MFSSDLLHQVQVSKSELLGIMKENLKTHCETIANLFELRRYEIASYCEKTLDQISGDSGFQPKSPEFPLPKDRSSDYAKAIRMVEMSVNDTIELTAAQFDRLVMDNWDWKDDLMQTSRRYGQ